MVTLYKRSSNSKPLSWSASECDGVITITHGLVGGTQHKETIEVTSKKVNELNSRINAKRNEGYKELSELKDNNASDLIADITDDKLFSLKNYLETYLPK